MKVKVTKVKRSEQIYKELFLVNRSIEERKTYTCDGH